MDVYGDVLVSASLYPSSIPVQDFRRALELFELIVSRETALEIVDVLKRSEFDAIVSWDLRGRFAHGCLNHATLIEVKEDIQASRDPGDNKFLSLCVAAGAKILVSSDPQLTDLHPFRGIDILVPRAFFGSLPTEIVD